MTTSETITGARTMWELVDRRAQASADHPLLIAPDGEVVTCGQFKERAERVAAGLQGLGISTGSVVSWQLPTQRRLGRAVHRVGPARGRAEPDHPPLSGTRGGVRPPPDRGAAVRTPRDLEGHRFRRHRRSGAGGRHEPAHHPHHGGRSPRRRSGPAAAAATGDGARGRAHPLDLLHVRLDGRPQRRAAHGSDPDRRWMGPRPRARYGAGRRRINRLPLRPHRRSRLPRHHALHGLPCRLGGSLLCARRPADLPRPRGDHGGWQHRVLRRLSRRAAQDARRSDPPHLAAHVGWRSRQATRGPLRGTRRNRRPRRGARVRHDRGADDLERVAP